MNRKLVESQIQLMLLSIELERQLEEHEGKDQTLEDYRQKAIDMEHHHTAELDELKEHFEATVREQTVSYIINHRAVTMPFLNRKNWRLCTSNLTRKKTHFWSN